MSRGSLRIYLGAAPGVGKTYAMLQEGQRRRDRGADVVIGIVETHHRSETAAQLGDLEVVARRSISYRGTTLDEMDVDAILERCPGVALVDELAHTNAPGSRNDKRWQDVEELLAAGIDVISTVNVQHLESMNDVVQQITGIEQQEVVPDAFVRAAEQIQLVDQTPEALRRRLAHGNVYPADRIDAALDHYFRLGNLSALRELALMWVADRVDEGLLRYRSEHHIDGTWETRERVVVALSGAPGADHVIRRAARITSRSRGELIGVHIRNADGLSDLHGDAGLDRNRELLHALGGEYRDVGAGDIAEALVRFARSQNATQIVLGASARSRWQQLTSGSVINDVVRQSGDIDVHVVTPDERTARRDALAPTAGGPPAEEQRVKATELARARVRSSPFSRRRLIWGWAVGATTPFALTALLASLRTHVGLSTNLLAFTLVVAVTAVIGGFPPAALAAISSFLLVNWYFTPPIYTWSVGEPENLLALTVFLADAAIIGFFVASAARRSAEATRVRADAETLAALAGSTVTGGDVLQILAEQLRRVVGARAVAVVVDAGGSWDTVASATDGETEPPRTPADGDLRAKLGSNGVLVIAGVSRLGVDDRVFDAFIHHLANALEVHRLQRSADRAEELHVANELRAGLLAAVSHDLRTPIAAIQAAASTLQQPDVGTQDELREEFTSTILDQTERLHRLVTNLLEMSRIHAEAVHLELTPVSLDDVVSAAVSSIDWRGRSIEVQVDHAVPDVITDAVLLERVVANLVDNACKWSPEEAPVRVDAAVVSELVILRVIDHGVGVPRARRADVIQPFQRVGDTASVTGTGLGLAVADGFTRLMGGELEIGDTPGGGTTVTIRLPLTREAPMTEEPQ